ncbi:VOC family protein [Aliiglaciecola litoralis]|uniref:VOC family protein n=1 Tax=Aliiglaciecola litoralis TaxID=582857 RepID=A0ABP3WQI0_9ALTE
MKPRISMITLGVANMAKAIDFYQNGLGFPRHGEGEQVAFFNLNGSWLGLYPKDALAEDAMVDSNASGFNAFSLAHNVGSEAEVEQVIQQAINAGATVTKTPRPTDWGGYSGYFKDPDGHLWEVAHNPHFWIGPEDTPK